MIFVEFIIFDTEKRLDDFIKNDDNPRSSMKIKINEMHLINKENFWFETDFERDGYTINLDNKYVHINPKVRKTRLTRKISDTVRINAENFKYHYNSSYLIVYKKFLWWNRVIHKKKVMTRFVGNPRTDKDISVNGNMFYNSSNNIIYVVLNK